MNKAPMTRMDAMRLRKSMLLSQGALAELLGMTERAWQDIENGRAKLRQVHILALERIALRLVAASGLANTLPDEVLHDAVSVVRDVVSDEHCRSVLLELIRQHDKAPSIRRG